MAPVDVREMGKSALKELEEVISNIDPEGFDDFIDEIAKANRIVLYGVGREGLMMRALAMRLYHLGLDAHVQGDMTTPPIGSGDLFIVSAGPGWFSSVEALAESACRGGARVACVTAQPGGDVPKSADKLLYLPAQTMADDQGGAVSVLPMGSLYEGAQYIVFELLVIGLRDRIGENSESMRARHTNME